MRPFLKREIELDWLFILGLRMTWSIGLNLGDSFAEVAATQDGHTVSQRWYLPQCPLPQQLASFLTQNKIDEVVSFRVATKLAGQILNRRLGTPPAFLTTAGFESWLDMTLPVQPSYFSISAKRVRSPLNQDLVFGLSERLSPKGEVVKPLDAAEVEFIASKLKMSEVKHVAVGLLHSNKNPDHEKQVAEILRNEGFIVHTSFDSLVDRDEKARWWAAILDAYVAPAFYDYFSNLRESLSTQMPQLPDFIVHRGYDDTTLTADTEVLSTLMGQTSCLAKHFQMSSKRKGSTLLYCGLEDFILVDNSGEMSSVWTNALGPIALKGPLHKRMGVQPTQVIGKSFWGSANYKSEESGYEPGPMCFGRGLNPTLIDILNAQSRLPDVEGFTRHIKDGMRGRLIETLFTLSRQANEIESFDQTDMPEWFETCAANKLFFELNSLGVEDLTVSGPLAPTVFALLKSRLPKVRQAKSGHLAIAECLSHSVDTPRPGDSL